MIPAAAAGTPRCGGALRLYDAGVLAAVQLHYTEAPPGDQLAQVPHPAHAHERDSYG
jgi:hypothetical protein